MDQGFGEDSEDEYDVSRRLLPEEVIGIMDQILCLEVRRIVRTWFVPSLRLRPDRLAGTSAFRYRKHCSLPSTLIDCYGLSLGHLKRPNSSLLGIHSTEYPLFSSFCALIVWQPSRLVLTYIRWYPANTITRFVGGLNVQTLQILRLTKLTSMIGGGFCGPAFPPRIVTPLRCR